MAEDYGYDLACADDLTELAEEIPGTSSRVVAQSVYRRLITPRGALLDDPGYGIDLRSLLHRAMSPTQIAALPGIVRAEVMRDDRVLSAEVKVLRSTLFEVELEVSCTLADADFALVISASQARVALVGGG